MKGEVSNSNLSESFSDFQLNSSIADDSRRVALGPTIQIQLPVRMSVESGALLRTVTLFSTTHTFQTSPPDPSDPYTFNLRLQRRTHVKSIEVPALLRFWLSDESIRPFVGTGYVYRRFFDMSAEVGGQPLTAVPLALIRSNHGVAVTGGVEVKTRFLRISPEVRYTRWSRRVFDRPSATAADTILNQFDLNFGIGL